MVKRAFTLIELLVVIAIIAIIAILAAILFPVFAQAKEAAKKTQCLSNAKQLGLGVYQYVIDSDDVLPMGSWRYGDQQSRWFQDVYPYIRNLGVFVCPAKTSGTGYYVPKLRAADPNGYVMGGPESSGNYGMNLNLVGSPYSASRPPAVQTDPNPSKSLTSIPDSSGTFLICETGRFDAKIIGNYDATTWPNTEVRSTDWNVAPPSDFTGGSVDRYRKNDTNFLRRPAARHSGGLNVIYCDGHAKYSKVTAFIGPMFATQIGWPYADARNSWDDR